MREASSTGVRLSLVATGARTSGLLRYWMIVKTLELDLLEAKFSKTEVESEPRRSPRGSATSKLKDAE